MTEQQQKLYDKLLKKVNEFCLGQAAEDVIECIDALVDTYEPKKIVMNCGVSPLQALQIIKLKLMRTYDGSVGMNGNVMFEKEIPVIETALKALETYRKSMKEWESGHSVDFSKVHFEIQNLLPDPDDIGKRLKAFEIIKEKKVDVSFLFNGVVKNYQDYNRWSTSKILTPEEYDFLKEMLK